MVITNFSESDRLYGSQSFAPAKTTAKYCKWKPSRISPSCSMDTTTGLPIPLAVQQNAQRNSWVRRRNLPIDPEIHRLHPFWRTLDVKSSSRWRDRFITKKHGLNMIDSLATFCFFEINYVFMFQSKNCTSVVSEYSLFPKYVYIPYI